ncbi:hypothetical protein HDU67_000885 [Dinochytrium kinnereticum]|nr:hypothetical protein HDU67_000885 [Dinochytrium kinnereticum]
MPPNGGHTEHVNPTYMSGGGAGQPAYFTKPYISSSPTATTFFLSIANRLTHLYLLIAATAISTVLLPLSILLMPVTLLVASPLIIVISATAYIVHALYTTWGLGPHMTVAARIAYATGKHVLGWARTISSGVSAVSSTIDNWTPRWMKRRAPKDAEGFGRLDTSIARRNLGVSRTGYFHGDEEYAAGTSVTATTDGTTSAASVATPPFMVNDMRRRSSLSQHTGREDFILEVDGSHGAIRPEGRPEGSGGSLMGSAGRTGGSGIQFSRGSSGYLQNNRWSNPTFPTSHMERRISYSMSEKGDVMNGKAGFILIFQLIILFVMHSADHSDHPHNQQYFPNQVAHNSHRYSLSHHNPYDPSYPSDLESIVSIDTESIRGSIFEGIDRSDSAYDSDLHIGSSGSVVADTDSVISRSSSLRSSRGIPFKVAFRYLSPHDATLIDLCNALYLSASVISPREATPGSDGVASPASDSGGSVGFLENAPMPPTAPKVRVSRGRETGDAYDYQVLVALRRDADPAEPMLEDLIAFVEFFHGAGDPRHLRVEKLLVSSHYENHGFGRRLLRELHRHRRVESVEVWSLWHAEHFYRSLGYNEVRNAITGERVTVDWGPLLLWVKSLPPANNPGPNHHIHYQHQQQQQYFHGQNRSGNGSSGTSMAGTTPSIPQLSPHVAATPQQYPTYSRHAHQPTSNQSNNHNGFQGYSQTQPQSDQFGGPRMKNGGLIGSLPMHKTKSGGSVKASEDSAAGTVKVVLAEAPLAVEL